MLSICWRGQKISEKNQEAFLLLSGKKKKKSFMREAEPLYSWYPAKVRISKLEYKVLEPLTVRFCKSLWWFLAGFFLLFFSFFNCFIWYFVIVVVMWFFKLFVFIFVFSWYRSAQNYESASQTENSWFVFHQAIQAPFDVKYSTFLL